MGIIQQFRHSDHISSLPSSHNEDIGGESLATITFCSYILLQVVGLCGNYNGDEADDFTPSYGGMPVTSPIEFGDSWKVIWVSSVGLRIQLSKL